MAASCYHIPVIIRPLEQLLYLNHVPCVAKGFLPQGKAPLLIDDLEHGVNVGVVQHKKALWILHGVAVLLQHGDAEAVERVDVPGVLIPGQQVNPLAHLVGGFVGESNAEDVPRQNAQFVHQPGEAVGQRPRLAGPGPRNDPHIALRGGDGLPLGGVQIIQDILHDDFPLL